MIKELLISVVGQGLHDITGEVQAFVKKANLHESLCTLFIQHTSASLLIQENYDPTAKADLENWMNRLVPENDPLYTHVLEGPDDMPAHIKASLTASSIAVPVVAGQLALGSWQGIFLWEHRHISADRRVIIHLS